VCGARVARWRAAAGRPVRSWAKEIRDQVEYRYVGLLDLVAADATARGSHQEALTVLDAAVGEDPDDVSRYSAIADQLLALGRHGTARYLARLAGIEVDGDAGLGPDPV
jgi:hypothetical protein